MSPVLFNILRRTVLYCTYWYVVYVVFPRRKRKGNIRTSNKSLQRLSRHSHKTSRRRLVVCSVRLWLRLFDRQMTCCPSFFFPSHFFSSVLLSTSKINIWTFLFEIANRRWGASNLLVHSPPSPLLYYSPSLNVDLELYLQIRMFIRTQHTEQE